MHVSRPWRESVERSLLAIGLLVDRRTGAIAAAGTTSLPEAIGGSRNFDYRYAWVRDLSFTVDALLQVGMEELSHAGLAWLLRAIRGTEPRVDPVYKLDGTVLRSQQKLELPGYRCSVPVHLGNEAGTQLQLGGFGDLIEAVAQYVDHGHVLAPSTGERIADCVDLLCGTWGNPDAGLWKLDDPGHYMTSVLDRVRSPSRAGRRGPGPGAPHGSLGQGARTGSRLHRNPPLVARASELCDEGG